MKPLFLFDFDGVVADSLDVFQDIVKRSLDLLGHKFIKTRDDFLDLFRDNLYASFAKKKVPSEDLAKLFSNIEKNTDFSRIGLYDDIKGVIAELRPIVDIAIVSSNREIQIEKILEANGVMGLFEMILGVNAGVSKVEKLKRATEHFGAALNDTYYVVDTTGDLKEAKLAGVNSVAVGWGWHGEKEMLAMKPEFFVKKPSDLLELARSICKRQ